MDMVCSLPNLTLLQYLTLLCPFSLSLFKTPYPLELGFPGGSVVKNLPINAGDLGLIPGLGRSPGEEMATHSSVLAWEIPWTEEPGRLQSLGWQNYWTQLSD